jgi:hypothetical protein
MQGKSTAISTGNASGAFGPLSRRSFLSAVGLSAAAPATAFASSGTIEVTEQLTDEEQLEACMTQIKAILVRMHPGYEETFGDCAAHRTGGATVMIGVRRPRVEWSGEGMYEVEDRHSRYLVPLWITREWSDMDRRHYLFGGVYFNGEFVAPGEVVHPDRIVRKLGGALS